MWLAFKLGVQYKFNRVTSAKLKICKVFSFVYVSSKNCSIWTDWIVSLCWICFYCPQGWSGWMHSSNQQLTAWPHELSTYFIVEFVLYCYIQGWPGWKHSSNQKPAVWPHEYSKYFNVEFVFFATTRDDPVESIRPIRNQLCDLMNITRPKMLKVWLV